MTGEDNPSIGEMIAEELRRRLIELEAEVQVGFAGAQDRLDAVRSLLNLWNSFAFEHIVKRSDLVPPAAFELHPRDRSPQSADRVPATRSACRPPASAIAGQHPRLLLIHQHDEFVFELATALRHDDPALQ
jgi:hypothetical protein